MNTVIEKFVGNAVRFVIAALMVTASLKIAANQAAGVYTSAMRYNLAGQVTGAITPDPDGTGLLHFQAKRNTYFADGLLKSTEHGVLLDWKDETVNPENWGPSFLPKMVISYSYNSMGQVETETSSTLTSSFALKHKSYDAYGRLECVAVRMSPRYYGVLPASACTLGSEDIYGPDRITKYVYDDKDNIEFEYRGFGTSSVITYASNTYDANHNKLSVKDSNGNLTKMTYDGHFRLEYIYFPSADKLSVGYENPNDFEKYTYDANGNRIYLRKRDGKEIVYKYDYLNRQTSKDLPGTQDGDVYNGYDLRGLRMYARFGSVSGKGITNTYNGFGDVLTETNDLNAATNTVSYKYDSNGNRERVTHPDGQYFTYYYDGLNRLEYVKENDSSNLTKVVYDDQAHLYTMTTGGNAVTTYTYNSEFRLGKIENQFSSALFSIIQDFTYNAANQVLSKGLSNDLYGYKEGGGQRGIYEANGLNQYTDVGVKKFGHDANGNLTSDASTTYVYDVENRLTNATGARNAALEYDPLGRLAKITSGAQSTSFLYSGDALISEYVNGGLATRYVHGSGVDLPLVSYTGNSVSSSNRRFLHANHQGSIIGGSDNTGSIKYINTYDSYGVPGAANQGRFAYTGQAYLAELGMYYYKARIYSPKIGRFLQTDPIGYKDDMNIYAYTGNDPINKNDSTGLAGQCVPGPCDPGESTKMGLSENWIQYLPQVSEIPRPGGSSGDTPPSSAWSKAVDGLKDAFWDRPLPGAGLAVAGIKGAAMFGRASINMHHGWPKYLGGPSKQSLVPLDAKLHRQYHQGLDVVAPRWRGAQYYEGLSPQARSQIMNDFADYTRSFDAKYGTSLFDAAVNNGFKVTP